MGVKAGPPRGSPVATERPPLASTDFRHGLCNCSKVAVKHQHHHSSKWERNHREVRGGRKQKAAINHSPAATRGDIIKFMLRVALLTVVLE